MSNLRDIFLFRLRFSGAVHLWPSATPMFAQRLPEEICLLACTFTRLDPDNVSNDTQSVSPGTLFFRKTAQKKKARRN
jgi:hypothetical protein